MTYYYIAKMMDAVLRGKRYFNDHIPDGYYVDAGDGIALCAIEECCHTSDFHQGKLRETTVGRDDLSESDMIPIIAEAIYDLQIPLYPNVNFQNIVCIV